MSAASQEWRDALDAIPLALSAAGIAADEPLAEIAYDAAVDTLIAIEPQHDHRRGSLRQFSYDALCQAVRWAKYHHVKSPKRTCAITQDLPTGFTPGLRFDADQLAQLPLALRRTVILHVHLGLSRYETGLLLGGMCNSRVYDRLLRAAVMLGLTPKRRTPKRERKQPVSANHALDAHSSSAECCEGTITDERRLRSIREQISSIRFALDQIDHYLQSGHPAEAEQLLRSLGAIQNNVCDAAELIRKPAQGLNA